MYVSAQNRKIDSLMALLPRAADSSYVYTCGNIADEYSSDYQITKAFNYIDSAIIRSQKVKSTRLLAYSYNLQGNLFNYVGDYSKALDSFDKALKNYEKISFIKGRTNVFLNRGNTYYSIGDYKKTEYNFRMALQYYFKGKTRDEAELGNIYNNLGSVLGSQNNFILAENYFKRALALYKKTGDSLSVGYIYNNLANIATSEERNEAALELFKKAKDLKVAYGSNGEKAIAYRNLAVGYTKLYNYKAALQELNNSLSFTDTTINNTQLLEVYKDLARVYERLKMPHEAVEYYKKLQRVTATVNEKEIANAILQKDMLVDLSRAYLADSLKQASHIQLQTVEISRNNTVKYSLIIIITLVVLFAVVLYKKFRESQSQKNEISLQKHLVDEKQKEIIDSISYAKRIQTALLSDELIKENLAEHFVLFKPKDIVSGDFYWTSKLSGAHELFYLAVCDSTGHGVPGAFMSILNSGFLNEALNERHILEPHKIFEHVRYRLIEVIGKDEQKDGFDGVLVCFNKTLNVITYAAANNGPVVISNNTLINLPYDKMPVGKGERLDDFKLYTLNAASGDTIYLFTDGYTDQFGGDGGKKLKSKALKSMLLEAHQKPLAEQKQLLGSFFTQWQNNFEQVDDVTIVGLKV